ICVVEDAKAVISFEKLKDYTGVYHVLGGVISPRTGISPNDLSIPQLIERVHRDGVEEVIIATNATVEGETTALYISRLLKNTSARTTRLAYGIPVGGDLEYADKLTLLRAIEGRRDF
ncbi:MAG: recombination protein RecR, partial [Clostridia bacterium]|nr:recombination protein RecR [Clostridia bacterium]